MRKDTENTTEDSAGKSALAPVQDVLRQGFRNFRELCRKRGIRLDGQGKASSDSAHLEGDSVSEPLSEERDASSDHSEKKWDAFLELPHRKVLIASAVGAAGILCILAGKARSSGSQNDSGITGQSETGRSAASGGLTGQSGSGASATVGEITGQSGSGASAASGGLTGQSGSGALAPSGSDGSENLHTELSEKGNTENGTGAELTAEDNSSVYNSDYTPYIPVNSSQEQEFLLKRWELDPEAFPPEDEQASPDIAEELLPYFHEKAAQAVEEYAGTVPPQADRGKYSARMYAIREAAVEKAKEAVEKACGECRRNVESLAGAMKEPFGAEFVASLEGVRTYGRRSDRFSIDSFELPGGTGVPFALPEPSGARVSDLFVLPQGRDGSSEDDAGLSGTGEGGGSGVFFLLGKADSQSDFGEELQTESESDSQNNTSGQVNSSEYADLISLFPEAADLPVPPILSDFSLNFPAKDVSVPDSDAEDQKSTAGRGDLEEESTDSSETVESAGSGKAEAEKKESKKTESKKAESEKEDSVSIRGSEESAAEILIIKKSRKEDTMDYMESGKRNLQVQKAAVSSSPRRTVFIGDSRTVGMEMYAGGREGDYWSARNSMGYSWMVNTGVPAVEDLIEENTDVVILMGVNDTGNMVKYIDYMNRKAAEWKDRGARTFFVSVTPVIDSKSRFVKNKKIEEFNSYARENLRGVSYIDAYTRIKDDFGSSDGIHFDGRTYLRIYDIIRFYLYRGWYEEAGLWFFFDEGEPLTGWQFLDGKWQYMDGCGVRWASDGRIGDVFLAPWPETGMLDPYQWMHTGSSRERNQ